MPRSPVLRYVAVLCLTACLTPAVLAQDMRVRTIEVERAAIMETVELTGSVMAPRTARLSSEIAGRVSERRVSLGDRVAEGQTLIVIDDAQVRHQVRAAEAEVKQAQVELDDLRRQLEEARQLREGQNIARSELRQRANAVAVAESILERRDAEHDRLETQLSRHNLTAPFSGLITQRNIEVGEWSSPGDELLTLVDLAHLRLDIRVPLSLYPRLDAADLDVRLPGEAQWRHADILATVPRDDEASRQFLLRAELAEAPPLLPGVPIRARLQLAGQEGPTVPRDALIRRPDGNISVWLAKQDGDNWFAEQRRVTVGPSQDGHVAIRGGIDVGDRVVVEGNERLEDDQRLTLDVE